MVALWIQSLMLSNQVALDDLLTLLLLIVYLIASFYVTEYVGKYATEEALREHDVQSSDSDSSLSEFSEDEAQDMEL